MVVLTGEMVVLTGEMVVLAGDGVRRFFLRIFGWRCTLADASQPKISQPNGDRPVPIGQREATTGFFFMKDLRTTFHCPCRL